MEVWRILSSTRFDMRFNLCRVVIIGLYRTISLANITTFFEIPAGFVISILGHNVQLGVDSQTILKHGFNRSTQISCSGDRDTSVHCRPSYAAIDVCTRIAAMLFNLSSTSKVLSGISF